MKKKILSFTIASMFMVGSITTYAATPSFVTESLLTDIIQKASQQADRQDVIDAIEMGLESPESIDIVKQIINRKVEGNEKVKNYLQEKGISSTEINQSLDSLKSWDDEGRKKLIEALRNNDTNKIKQLILNDGTEPKEQTTSTPSGGGTAAKPGDEVKKEEDKKVEEQVTNKEAIKETVKEVSQETTKTFQDIKNHWAKENIEAMATLGIVNGVEKDTFAPEEKVTRSQMATFIVKLFNLQPQNQEVLPFKDMNSNNWDYTFVKAAYDAKIISGVSKDEFSPNTPVTREQMMVMIMNALKYRNALNMDDVEKNLSSFEDTDMISPWAKEAMENAVALEFMKGRTNTTLAPQGVATRAEAITIINKVYNFFD